MKKILVLLLMFTLLSAVSCDDDEGGGGVVRLQDLDSEQIHPADSTEAEGVGDKFTSVLSSSYKGWSAYRWTTSTDDNMPETTADDTDCDGAYKVSYFERASNYAPHVHRFVGGGMCLDSGNSNTDVRVVNLRALVNEVMEHSLSGINRFTGSDDIVNANIIQICNSYDQNSIDNVVTESGVDLNDENDELYLFIAEVVEDGTTVGSVSAVNIVCHPDQDLVDNETNIYGYTDDSGNAYIKEVVDELHGLELDDGQGNTNDQELINEGVWNVHTFPKLGEPETLDDPPKLSYFRISNEVGDNKRRFIVGAGIYLEVNNPNAGTSNRLEPIRNRVRGAAALLLVGEDEEGGLNEMFFENDADNNDATDFYSQFIMTTPAIPEQEYIFVWENR